MKKMSNKELESLRQQADALNLEILKLINERGAVVKEIGKAKEAQGVNRFDPVRERTMLNRIIESNDGPFENSTIQHIFKEIFKAGLELQEEDHSKALLVSRKKKAEDTIVDIKGEKIGDGDQRSLIAVTDFFAFNVNDRIFCFFLPGDEQRFAVILFLKFKSGFENFFENMLDRWVFKWAVIAFNNAVKHCTLSDRVKSVDTLCFLCFTDFFYNGSAFID